LIINFIVDKNIIFSSALEWLIENGILNEVDVSSAFSKEKDLYLTVELKVLPKYFNEYIIKFNPDLYLLNASSCGFAGFPMSEHDNDIEDLFIPLNNISCIYKNKKNER